MAEKLNRYYQIYNELEDYLSEAFTEKQLLDQFRFGINLTPSHGRISFEVSPIMLTEKQFNDKSYFRNN